MEQIHYGRIDRSNTAVNNTVKGLDDATQNSRFTRYSLHPVRDVLIAWRVPLGSFEELDKLGVPKTGTPTTNGGSIATAGGLVFIGATVDGKFRAFDSRTGKELWVTDLGVDINSIPITWQGKDGRQYVAVFASGGAHNGAKPGRLLVYTLPKT